MKIRNKNDLEKLLKKVAKKALETEVAKTAEEVMKDKIDSEVYDAYTPYSSDGETPHYERTYKLRESTKTEMIGDTILMLYNDRFDEDEQISKENAFYHDSGRYIPSVIESGKGYEWGYERDLDSEIGARPFGEKTYEELKNGEFKKALIRGIKEQGIKAK
jgi:hypothetical protein